jgi:propanol-preferring alcohol dehydrogenase
VEVLELAGRRLLRAETTTFSLDAAPDAYDALAAGAISGRAVVVPNTAP